MTSSPAEAIHQNTAKHPMRVCFVLPGLHRVHRGAETAFESVAAELAKSEDCAVTLFGSGQPIASQPYTFIHVPCRPRERFERWPTFPGIRTESAWEELSFIPSLYRVYNPLDFDVSVTCSYPYTNWFLRSRRRNGYRPAHVYVTQNGDWACQSAKSEYRWFGCDGLVCTNPEYYERNKERWNSALIPNGVDSTRFFPGREHRSQFNIPEGVPIVLMVSALIESKRVLEAIEAVSLLDNVYLIVAGDGPLREQVLNLAAIKLPGRFQQLTVAAHRMPTLYRCADLVLHMSLEEPFGNVYLEATASGLPIVANNHASTRWILEATGKYVDGRNKSCVADSIKALLTHDAPEALSLRRELVERRYTWKAIAAQYQIHFEKILSSL